ncbi:MAG: MgtC/SapB family protein [Bacteroidetes bacterium]|nr:MgtC/SapB family protein [Bacteroidota bacterium]
MVGFERQWQQRNAGLRTNALVSLGAALYVLISVNIYDDDASPSRIASQIVTGIGFLGAGVIIKEGINIRGLNTAATLWCSAAIGSLTGMGFWREAGVGAIVVILAHLSLRPLGYLIGKRSLSPGLSYIIYTIKITCPKKNESNIRAILMRNIDNTALKLYSLNSSDTDTDNLMEIKASILSIGRNDNLIEEVTSMLGLQESIKKISWEIEREDKDQDNLDL